MTTADRADIASDVIDSPADEPPPARRTVRTGLDRLFAATADRAFTVRGKWLVLTAVAAGTVVSLLRTTGTGPLQSIWEEDARDILTDPMFSAGIKTLVRPAVGYFVVVPRMTGALANFLPLTWSAAVLSISSAVLTALMAVLVYHAGGAHLTSRLARVMVSAPMLIAPIAENNRSEIYNRPVCLHFFMLYTVFWVLLWIPARRSGRIVAYSAVGLSAFTTILTVGFLPLALLRALVRRDRTSVVMFLLLAAGGLADLIARSTGFSSRGVTMRPDPLWAIGEFVFWALPQSLVGYRLGIGLDEVSSLLWTEGFWAAAGRHAVLIASAWLLVLAVVVVAVRRYTRPAWPLVAVAALHTAGLFCMMVMAQGTAETRYLYPVEMLAFATLTLLLLPSAERVTRRLAGLDIPTAVAPLAAFAVFVGVISGFNYRWDDTYRAQAPRWTDQVRRAALECQENPQLQKVYVRSAPAQFWSVVIIPCSRVRNRGPHCLPPDCAWIDSEPYVTPSRRE